MNIMRDELKQKQNIVLKKELGGTINEKQDYNPDYEDERLNFFGIRIGYGGGFVIIAVVVIIEIITS
jgi:hypothetical protein